MFQRRFIKPASRCENRACKDYRIGCIYRSVLFPIKNDNEPAAGSSAQARRSCPHSLSKRERIELGRLMGPARDESDATSQRIRNGLSACSACPILKTLNGQVMGGGHDASFLSGWNNSEDPRRILSAL